MSMLYRFQNLQPAKQLIVLTAIFDPIGFAAGFLLGPSAGVDPIIGGAGGLMVSSTIVSLWFVAGRT